MIAELLDSVAEIPPADWDNLVPDGNPFLSYVFLAALENHGAVGPRYGWLPHYVVVRDSGGKLLGAAPMYEKDNSYGEMVFDWAWADAYDRAGGKYYPKLVVASPYTPATGPRLLVSPSADHAAVVQLLIDTAIDYAKRRGLSSLHWLFTNEADTAELVRAGLALRVGCQFHWFNHGYQDFDHFLAQFSSAKRKKLRRERKRVVEQGVSLQRLTGEQVTSEQWTLWHRFYRSTFDRKGGIATLSEGFFREIGQGLGDRVLLVFAHWRGRPVAAALMLRSDRVLYGRHWGCDADFHSLHFEACYYQGLEYAIERGLAVFEPGAQGEHKIQRGFIPTSTYSAHWLSDPGFSRAINRFVAQEQLMMGDYMAELCEHLPFRHPDPNDNTPCTNLSPNPPNRTKKPF